MRRRPLALWGGTARTTGTIGGTTSATSGATLVRIPASTSRSNRTEKSIQTAVYAYVRARRALGEATISVGDIARALDLPMSEVARAANALRDRGVKPLK
jgi:hypothetical protein